MSCCLLLLLNPAATASQLTKFPLKLSCHFPNFSPSPDLPAEWVARKTEAGIDQLAGRACP
jgi:hypothetical protein